MVEYNLAKVGVVGSNPIARSKFKCAVFRYLDILSCVVRVGVVLGGFGFSSDLRYLS